MKTNRAMTYWTRMDRLEQTIELIDQIAGLILAELHHRAMTAAEISAFLGGRYDEDHVVAARKVLQASKMVVGQGGKYMLAA